MAAVEAPARSKCEVCPFAGSCNPCRPVTVRGESGSGEVFVYKDIKVLLSLPELPVGRIYIDSVSPAKGGSNEPPIRTSEKTCSICKEPASTCLHSETSKR